MEEPRAKVFVSCGQREHEIRVVHAVRDELIRLGFEPYVAIRANTLQGLKESIFRELETSEYFLFIDFAREELGGSPAVSQGEAGDRRECRGSLFVNQELAIASYLGLDALGFQHSQVKQLDGILAAVQLNVTRFDETSLLPTLIQGEVEAKLQTGAWSNFWKRGLRFEGAVPEWVDASILNLEGKPMGRFYHLGVRNLHKWQAAKDCTAYLRSIKPLALKEAAELETVELKWAGSPLPQVPILPASSRKLDAFHVRHDSPGVLRFNFLADSSRFTVTLDRPGTYRLAYVVMSGNLPTLEESFDVHLGGALDDIRLGPASDESRGSLAEAKSDSSPWSIVRISHETTTSGAFPASYGWGPTYRYQGHPSTLSPTTLPDTPTERHLGQ